jgi:methylenetetrahydrofolate dehydrogenase (NADP+) / methenyltetrahydrofolate cyclohydrolase
MGICINGKELAKEYKDKIKFFIEDIKNKNSRIPCIATILVGEDGGSTYYVKNQNKLCDELGIMAKNFFLEETISEEELVALILNLNQDNGVDGIMLQVPLPKHLNEKVITSMISYTKDVDGLTDVNLGKFYKGDNSFVPCTARSIIELIKSTGCNISGKNAVVLGRSNIVGKPVAQLLLNENATVTICHSKTNNLKDLCKTADILVAAIGKPSFVTKDFVKEGAIIIDVGTTMVEGKVKGDVSFEEVIQVAAFVSPVPGGVGSMTTTMLIQNTCEAYNKNVY